MVQTITNITGYKFTTLERLPELREHLLQHCHANDLKGTILLAPEGINILLAGVESGVTAFLAIVKQDSRFADMEFKYSYSETIPFKKMLVKIKKEIITFNVPNLDPVNKTGKHLAPKELKKWIDENKDIVIIDARNQFEIDAGKFKNALSPYIEKFTEFPEAFKQMNIPKDKVIVTYCTGGIRCEKASAYIMDLGYESVYQIDGGILKYFEECGAAHYEGKCFVFDERIALNEELK